MSFTKFLDIAQEDNGSISGAVSVSGTDPGSHCFQEGQCLGLFWYFPPRVSKPPKVGAWVGGEQALSMATKHASL